MVSDRFLTDRDETFAVLEAIPATNGRIVSSDGVVLAFDRTRFNVSVHYRYIEDPPNARWLTQQARERLEPRERRDRKKLDEAKAEVLADRSQFWSALAKATGTPVEELNARRFEIQKRVQRMARSVESRRTDRAPESVSQRLQEPRGTFSGMWQTIVSELTSPPRRESVDPIVLKEELQYHPLLEDLPLASAAEIESAPTRFPPAAIAVHRRSERVYPGRDLAAHVIGVRRSETAPGAVEIGTAGENGIEQTYDAILRGENGVRKVIYNRRREIVTSTIVRPPVDGEDVTLSIVSQVQRDAEAILERALSSSSRNEPEAVDESAAPTVDSLPRGGTIVAIDVRTGELIAAACAPRFDLNLINEFDRTRWQQLLDDPRRPFFPRITALTAPPGSVFKVLTAVAALEEDAIDPLQPIHCQGYLHRPDQLRCMIYRQSGASHGDIDLSEALCQSCNVYFFEAARRMGDEPLRRWSEKFGFGAPTGADLPREAAGRLPDPLRRTVRAPATTNLQMAIGQSSLLVSPLQVARMMAAIANGGTLVSPRFARIGNSADRGNSIQLASFESAEANIVPSSLELSPRTVAVMRESLERVVSDPRGTGKAARVASVRVAGKTGTAETGGGLPDHAWFAGYVPADRPRVAFVVMLEHAGSGGRSAGPVVRELVDSLLRNRVIEPDSTQPER